MYSYGEIQFQNQQDCFSLLFLSIGRNVMSVMGRKGETVIRKAVQEFGLRLGKEERARLESAGRLPNLKELVQQEDGFLDPRFRILPLRMRQQELWAEVHTCPIADYMKHAGASGLGLMFCEEFCHAFFNGYTDGKAQANLSKTLMGPYDNHCRFSIYYRPANLEAGQREKVFDPDTAMEEAKLPEQKTLHNTERLQEAYMLLYGCLYDMAEQIGGTEGLCAVALGLRELVPSQREALERWAKARGMECDDTFIGKNCPIPMKENTYLNEKQETLFRENFLARF